LLQNSVDGAPRTRELQVFLAGRPPYPG